jgi:hypothetical protein
MRGYPTARERQNRSFPPENTSLLDRNSQSPNQLSDLVQFFNVMDIDSSSQSDKTLVVTHRRDVLRFDQRQRFADISLDVRHKSPQGPIPMAGNLACE